MEKEGEVGERHEKAQHSELPSVCESEGPFVLIFSLCQKSYANK